MALAPGCSVASDFLDSADVSMIDSEGLHMPWTASTLMDSRQLPNDAFCLAGDPYCELDDVTRSVDLNSVADAFKAISSNDALDMVPGDYALAAWTGHEAAANLGCNENFIHDTVAINPIDDAIASWKEQDAAEKLDCNKMVLKSHTVPYFRRFQATDVPPGVPLHVCFRLQPTTYWLCGVDAHVAVNLMLDFLTANVTMTITKVRHAKFSIKVNICIEGSNCVAKLRMYNKDASRALALELQQRSGHSLIFNRFY